MIKHDDAFHARSHVATVGPRYILCRAGCMEPLGLNYLALVDMGVSEKERLLGTAGDM